MPHTAFHSSVYMLAFGSVADEHQEAVWKYVKSRIDPPFAASDDVTISADGAASPPSSPSGTCQG